MGGLIRRYQNILILVALLAFSLTLLLSNLREKSSLNFLEKAAITVLAPFQEFVDFGADKIYTIWGNYINLVGVKEENQHLRQRVDKLAFENSLLVEQFKHYERLDQVLSFPRLDMIPYETAQIIGRDTIGRVRLLYINKGSEDGLKKNMPVITHRGLIGRTVRVALYSSKVLMISDVRSAVDAIVQETRDNLVVAGSNTNTLEVRYLKAESEVKAGDRVISSGLGGIYPKGLLVGIIEDIDTVSEDLFLSARLTPTADLDRIEEVLVLSARSPVVIDEKDWP